MRTTSGCLILITKHSDNITLNARSDNLNRNDKPKMQSADLIKQLKNDKGITFNIISEQDAGTYIKDINNYLRTASYRKNYEKHRLGSQKGKYIDLDFAYLTDLSTIDMHLRNILLKMCIDVEHALKTKLLSTIEDNPNEDGYSIVESFLSSNPEIISSIEKKADSIFTGQLIEKYFSLCSVFSSNSGSSVSNLYTKIISQDCPVWVLVELISFGDTLKLIKYYNTLYPNQTLKCPNSNILQPIKSLRNACAHNNCLLNNLNVGLTTPNQEITNFISSMKNIGKEERSKKLSCRPLFEIVCLLKVYNEFVSPNVRKHSMTILKDFIHTRMFRNISYYGNNQVVKTSFEFLKKVLDNLA